MKTGTHFFPLKCISSVPLKHMYRTYTKPNERVQVTHRYQVNAPALFLI